MRVTAAKIERKAYTLSEFRGVDYSSSPLEVKPYRATDMANLLLRDGVLHKRYGWEQLSKIGTWDKAADMFLYGDLFIVRYVEGTDSVRRSIYFAVNPKDGSAKEIFSTQGKARHAMAHEYKGELFITDGTYHKLYWTENKEELKWARLDKDCGVWEEKFEDGVKIYEIEEHAPYVPLTTINIVCLEGDSKIIEAYPRTKNDSLNLLSGWRKNMLVCEQPSKLRRYKLDGIPYEPTIEDMNSENGLSKTHYPILTMKKGNETRQFIFLPHIDEKYPDNPYWTCSVNDCYYGNVNNNTLTLVLGKYSTLEAVGKLVDVSDGDLEGDGESVSSGRTRDVGFLLIPAYFCPWVKKNTWSYEDIEITLTFFNDEDVEKGYTAETEEVFLDTIREDALYAFNEPTISVLHGVSGANDRLFLAGNSEEARNLVFYTENEDLTHIPAVQQLLCGDTNAEISALERLADGSLAVFKDVSSLRETSIYYITGKTVSLGVQAEGNEYFSDAFAVSSGTISENGVSARSTINYDGDSLFASKDGVYAIVLSENILSTERYARERSRPIATKLKEHDLTNAAAVVFEDMYWLSVGDGSGEVYVADGKHKYATDGTPNNSYNYEWFRLTNIPAVCFLEKGDELYFLSEDGWLCKFHKGYTDIYTMPADSGNFTVSTLENGKRVVSYNGALRELIENAAYLVDDNGLRWEIFNVRTETIAGYEINVFDVPEYAEVENGAIGFKIHVAVKSYWKSAALDFGSPIYKKNLWAISVSATPTEFGSINVGFKTRRENMLEGLNAFSFGTVDFSMFSFDCSGFINTFRQKVFERGLIYLQMMYTSNSIGDAVVNSITVEYSVTHKGLGVG